MKGRGIMKKNLEEMQVKVANKRAILESHDGEEFSPITVAKNVLCEDGTTMQDYFDNHSEPNISTKIVNSNSMSKVGQGDSVDFSDNVMNGAYEDVVLKGKSLVNVIQGSSKDKVTLDSENATAYPVVIKPNTKYSIIAHKDCNYQTDNLIYTFDLGGATTTCSVNDTITMVTTPSTLAHQELRVKGQGLVISSVRVIEGEVTQDLPYFEGICDVKSPIVKNVGKNLCNVNRYMLACGSGVALNGYKGTVIAKNIKVKPNTTYTFSYGNTVNIPSSVQLKVMALTDVVDEDVHVDVYTHKNRIYEHSVPNGGSFTTEGGTRYIAITTGNFTTTGDILIEDIEIKETTSSTTYEPYKSNTTTFTSNDDEIIVLRSLPNGVCDTLNVKTGEYVQIIGEITLDGTKRDDLVYHTVLKDNDGDFIRMIINGCSFYDNNKYGNCDKLPFYHEEKTKDSVEAVFPFAGEKHFYIKIKTSRINGAETMENNSSQLRDAFLNWLAQNPITVQYELATPIVKQVNVEGYPYAYENGHILLESGSQEQSLTPTIEYSIVANRGGQIRSNQRMVERHQKKLDSLYAMTLVNMIDSQYKQVLMKLKSDLGSEVTSWDI